MCFFLSFCGSVFLSLYLSDLSCVFFRPVLPLWLSFHIVVLSCVISFFRSFSNLSSCSFVVFSFFLSRSFFLSFLLSFLLYFSLSLFLSFFLSFFPSLSLSFFICFSFFLSLSLSLFLSFFLSVRSVFLSAVLSIFLFLVLCIFLPFSLPRVKSKKRRRTKPNKYGEIIPDPFQRMYENQRRRLPYSQDCNGYLGSGIVNLMEVPSPKRG